MRQRDYRLRRAEARVTDHGSPVIVLPGGTQRNRLGSCAVCGRYSRWIDPFPANPSWTATHGRQTFENIRFQMIANTPERRSGVLSEFRSDGSCGCHGLVPALLSQISSFRTWRNLYPQSRLGWREAVLLVAFISFLAIVNYLGVAKGTLLNNLFAATKLIVLLLFIVAGLAALLIFPAIRVTPDTVSSHAADWFEALILIVYAYGGFESALFPSGEARDPRKDAPIALCVAVITATFLYVALQYVVIHILPHAAATSTPAADVAKRLLGSLGASLLTVGILVSLYGSLSANMLETPRLTFAMGEQGDFPKFFAAIHPRFRSPHLSIAAFALLLTAFSIGGTFKGNAILSAGSRLFVYAATAAALPVLRRKHPSADAFRLPFGIAFSVLALVFTGLLVARIQIRDLIVIAAAFSVGVLNWLWARRIPSALSVLAANGVESGL
jgi:APA family basic amino acid/polyamine antiporter